MHVTRIIAATSVVLLTSCKSASAPVNPIGSFMLTYAGANSGNWSANGAFSETPLTRQTNAWAASDLGTNTVFTNSMVPRNATSHDFALLTIRRRTVGTETLTAGCSGTCSRLYIMFGAPNSGTAGALFMMECTMTVGTITISSISSTRVSGTFSGTGTCTPGMQAGGSFTVTNGTFDTAILPNV